MPGTYERLSALDEAFLAFETPETYMHVAMTAIFEAGSLATPEGGVDMERIRAHIASRLGFVPRYRQRLQYIPVVNEPVWVDDDEFDLSYHVRHASLPRPGGERQLQRRCAEILERHLDRTKPLWEIWIIEGLSEGRFAMLAKVHHCMVDGIAGVDLLVALLDGAPSHTSQPEATWTPRPRPAGRQLLRDEVARRSRASLGLIRGVTSALRQPRRARTDLQGRLSAVWQLVTEGWNGAPPTVFNQPLGPHRRVDWTKLDLARVKQVKNALGGTINDVVLTTVAGAVRHFLERRGLTAPPDLRVLVPVNVRTAVEAGALGNRVSLWLTSVPARERDPRRRFALIREETARLKNDHRALGAETLVQAADWTTGDVVDLAARLVNRASPYNLIVTNVPGPQTPFYLCDAPMVAAYPHLPLFSFQGIGVALFSYAGALYWGCTAEWNLIPDLAVFTEGLVESFEELCRAAEVVEITAPSPAGRTRRAPRGGKPPRPLRPVGLRAKGRDGRGRDKGLAAGL